MDRFGIGTQVVPILVAILYVISVRTFTLKPNKFYSLPIHTHTHTYTHTHTHTPHTHTLLPRHTPFKAFHLEIAFNRQGD